jgi:hypothetical protein
MTPSLLLEVVNHGQDFPVGDDHYGAAWAQISIRFRRTIG